MVPENGCCFVSGKNQYRPGSLTRASELREFPDKEAAQSSSGGVIHLYAVTGPQLRAVQLDTVSWENTYLCYARREDQKRVFSYCISPDQVKINC